MVKTLSKLDWMTHGKGRVGLKLETIMEAVAFMKLYVSMDSTCSWLLNVDVNSVMVTFGFRLGPRRWGHICISEQL